MKQQTKFKETEIGMIPEDWETKSLEEVAVVNETTIDKSFPDDEIEYIDIASVDKGRILERKEIPRSGAPSRAQRICRTNDILLSTVRPNLKHFAFLEEAKPNTIASTGFAVISAKKIAPHFLYYYLTTDKYTDFLAAIADAHTSTYPAFNPDVLENSIIPIPPKSEQRAIAKILSDLDSKIELNCQMNKTLEAIGQAIFKRWFVDFEFPNEKGKPYKSSAGEMIDSELGEIPRGWKVEKLRNFIRVERGLSYKGSGLCEEGIPLINLGNIAPNNNFKYEGLKFYSGDYKERNLVKPRDLIIANTDITQKREVLGSCLIVPSDLGSDKLLFTHHIYAIRPLKNKDALPKHFLSYLLQTSEYRERATGFATGTTVLALPEDAILDFNFVMSNRKILQEFDILLTFIKERSSKNIMESKNLSQIRDSLLPRLMSGKIKVEV